MKLWSFSTTVRNPERILPFLKVLKLLEGKQFNKKNQALYQILLIKHREYKPSNIPLKFQSLFKEPLQDISFEIAEEVFNYQNYNDPPHRGRESANPLTKLGFCIARESEGNIIITELGNKFINGDYDIGYAFFKSLLKLQFPNPWNTDFSAKHGFDVVPFIATLHLIKKVNIKSTKRGLSRNEFNLFIPSLNNYKLIDKHVESVFDYRKSKNKKIFIEDFARGFYKTEHPSEKKIKNFSEYGDNIMRYFRLTRYFRVEVDQLGADWRIDIEPTREVEIDQILQKFNGKSFNFKTSKDYLNYISDISLPKLPTEDLNNAIKVAQSLINTILAFSKNNNIKILDDENNILKTKFSNYGKSEIDNYILLLRQINLDLKYRKSKSFVISDKNLIIEIINTLKNIKQIRKMSPEKFEQLLTNCLRIMNDEIKIKPNYPVDDNGEPISHAGGGQADIECYYNSYNLICEVTLNTSNFQWVRESQPVMRHLKEFNEKNSDKTNYCLFISPNLHIDTIYHFFTSIKHGYDGSNLQIVPLTTEQFSVFLEVLLELFKKGRRFTNKMAEELYKEVIFKTNTIDGHSEWLIIIPQILEKWKRRVVAL